MSRRTDLVGWLLLGQPQLQLANTAKAPHQPPKSERPNAQPPMHSQARISDRFQPDGHDWHFDWTGYLHPHDDQIVESSFESNLKIVAQSHDGTHATAVLKHVGRRGYLTNRIVTAQGRDERRTTTIPGESFPRWFLRNVRELL